MIEQEIFYFYNFEISKKPFKGCIRNNKIVIIGKKGLLKATVSRCSVKQVETFEEAVEGWNTQVLSKVEYYTNYLEYLKKQYIT